MTVRCFELVNVFWSRFPLIIYFIFTGPNFTKVAWMVCLMILLYLIIWAIGFGCLMRLMILELVKSRCPLIDRTELLLVQFLSHLNRWCILRFLRFWCSPRALMMNLSQRFQMLEEVYFFWNKWHVYKGKSTISKLLAWFNYINKLQRYL